MANRRGKTESNDRFYFLGSKITVDADCRHEIKGRLLLGRKAMTNLCVCVHAQLLSHVWLHALDPRLLWPWSFPDKNTGVGCHFLPQGIFRTQCSNPHLLHLLHWQVDSLPPCHLRSPMTNLESVLKSRDISLPTKVCIVIAVIFPIVVCGWESWTHKEDWTLKNWCFRIAVLEKTLESPLDCKKVKPVNPKGNQLWIFIGSTVAEAEAPILWPPDVKGWLIGKDPDAGKDGRQNEAAKDEMVR